MKILVVTGLLAAESVKDSVGDSADVLVLPVQVAALITPQKLIAGFFQSVFSANQYDAVLVSGFSKFNFLKAEEEIGCPIYLGPKHAVDLRDVVSCRHFSRTVPACELIRIQKKEQVKKTLEEYKSNEKPAFSIGGVSIGGRSRMKILAEIVAAESLSRSELKSQISYLIAEGADLIDIGFLPDTEEETVSSVISFVKSFCSVPISIDSSQFLQIISGIEAGADLVLSADSKILQELADFLSCGDFSSVFDNVAFVVIPDLFSGEDRLKTLEQNIAAAYQIGIKNVIADPILSPPGHRLLSSLNHYYLFHQNHPNLPILFGAGNVTELFDADSVGINALLSEIAEECGASILFTPHASDKGKGSVRELKIASEMMVLSDLRRSSPKDLGIDLLILKEKRKRPDFNLSVISESGAFTHLHLKDDEIQKNTAVSSEKSKVSARTAVLSGTLNPQFAAGMKWGWKPDPAGNFLIGVLGAADLSDYLIHSCGFNENGAEIQKLNDIQTPGKRVIVAVHQKEIIVGTDSAFMLEEILNHRLVSELGHAGYLGRELQKAEIAVLLDRSYSQDDTF